jgi:hypothetical protein
MELTGGCLQLSSQAASPLRLEYLTGSTTDATPDSLVSSCPGPGLNDINLFEILCLILVTHQDSHHVTCELC